MLSLRARLFIVISLIVFIVLVISLFLLYRAKRSPEPVATVTPTTTAPTNVIDSNNFNNTPIANPQVVTSPAPTRKPTTLEAEQNWTRQLAKIFTERYFTYSTDSNYENIKEVQSFVTPELWKRISRVIGTTPSSTWSGVTTVVVSSKLLAWAPPTATVELKAQQTTEKNNVSTQSQRTFTITLTKIDEQWFVDSFASQK